MGTLLLLSKAILHGAGQSVVEARSPDALRPGGFGFSIQPLRTPRAAGSEGSGLSGNSPHRGLAVLESADPQMGEVTGCGRRVRALGMGSSGTGPRRSQLRD